MHRQLVRRIRALSVFVVMFFLAAAGDAGAVSTGTSPSFTATKGHNVTAVLGTQSEPCELVSDPGVAHPYWDCGMYGDPSDVTISINWGDGTAADTTTGTASRTCGQRSCVLTITGSHIYESAGTFNGTATWNDPDASDPGSSTFTADVSSTLPPATERLDFDELAAGTVVGATYSAQGITFGQTPSGTAAGNVHVVAHGAYQGSIAGAYDQSLPNAAEVTSKSDSGVWAKFATPVNQVSLRAGDLSGSGGTVTLTGYDASGTRVTSSSSPTGTSTGAYNPLAITAASSSISYISVTESAPTGSLVIDDVEYPVDGVAAYTVGGKNFSLTSGTNLAGAAYSGTYSGPVASITESTQDPFTASDYKATIEWGDGHVSTGTIAASTTHGQNWVISGTHTYAPVDSEHSLPVVVHVTKSGTALIANAHGIADVSPPPPAPDRPEAKISSTPPYVLQFPTVFDASASVGSTCTGTCAPASWPIKEYDWLLIGPSGKSSVHVSCPADTPKLTVVLTDPGTWDVSLQVVNTAGGFNDTDEYDDFEPNNSYQNPYNYASNIAVCGEHSGELPVISSVSPSQGITPRDASPGTTMTIFGRGFAPGTTVDFGNSLAGGVNTNVSSDGTRITAQLPATATTGPVTLHVPMADGSTLTLSGANPVDVDGYRNTQGYAFPNQGPSTITWDELELAFGPDQTHLTINPCSGDCPVMIDSPLAQEFLDTENAVMDGKGSCWGISLTSLLFQAGVLHESDFPPRTNGDVYSLGGTAAPSDELTRYITAAQVGQMSSELMGEQAVMAQQQLLESGPAANRTIHDKLLAALQAHEHPIIVLRNATVGHAVVAYNMVDNADSSFNIWVYDSNAPYGSNEPTGALSSVIRVNPDGTWSLPSTGISGSRSGLLVLRLADLPSNPHMYNVPAFAGSLLIGAPGQTTTQVTDAAGHTMFDAAGNLNADPTTHIDGMPYVPATDGTQPIDRQMFVFPHGEQTLTPTITADRSGQASITELSAGDQSTVQVSGRPGAQDQISLAPGTGSVSVAGTPAAVSFDVEQQTTTGLEHVNVTSAGGSAPTLTVDHSGAVSFGSASPAKVNITVSRVPTHGVPTSVSAKRVTVGPNAKLTISARGTSLRLGHQKLGTARSSAGPRGAVSQLQIQARAGKLIANSTASLPRGSEGASFIWQLSRHGRPVLSRTVRLDPRRRTAAVRLSLPIRQTAGLVLTGRLIVVTERGHFPVMGVTARSAALRNVILAR